MLKTVIDLVLIFCVIQCIRHVPSKYVSVLFMQVPLFLIRIEDLMSALDEKVTWREWKYLFKLGTSKVVSCPTCMTVVDE